MKKLQRNSPVTLTALGNTEVYPDQEGKRCGYLMNDRTWTVLFVVMKAFIAGKDCTPRELHFLVVILSKKPMNSIPVCAAFGKTAYDCKTIDLGRKAVR
jgi:hypothetical protein